MGNTNDIIIKKHKRNTNYSGKVLRQDEYAGKKSFGYNKQRQELFGINVYLFQNEVIQFLEK